MIEEKETCHWQIEDKKGELAPCDSDADLIISLTEDFYGYEVDIKADDPFPLCLKHAHRYILDLKRE